MQWTAETLKRKINGYSYAKKGFRKEDFMRLRLYPAGSLNGTPNALIKYAAELAKKSSEHSLLFSNPATKDRLFGETYRSFGAASGLAHGFWEYTKNNGIFGHEGGTYGFKTHSAEPVSDRARSWAPARSDGLCAQNALRTGSPRPRRRRSRCGSHRRSPR